MEKPKLIEYLGKQFNTPTSKYKSIYGIFECHLCGKHFRCRIADIKRGYTNTCGCGYRKRNGLSAGRHYSGLGSIYNRWRLMIKRCYDKKAKGYHNYGGRGITVCDEWMHDFQAFYNWALSHGYEKILTIDRRNNDGNYEPDNCRWVTRARNVQNTRLILPTNTSGYRGVKIIKHYRKTKNKVIIKYATYITFNNVEYWLGQYDDIINAAKAYNQFVIENNTDHPLNIIPNS